MSECCRSDTFLRGNAKTVDFEGLESMVYLYEMGGNHSFPPISSNIPYLFSSHQACDVFLHGWFTIASLLVELVLSFGAYQVVVGILVW